MKNFIVVFLGISICSLLFGSPRGIFRYEDAGVAGRSGSFTFYNKDGKQDFHVSASAGYLNDANNPYSQGLKNKGPIPGGKWFITSIKDHGKSILRIEPDKDTFVGKRDGFLIHGFASGSSPQEASRGCIILGPNERKILRDAFIDNNKKPIVIMVMAVASSSGG